MSKNSLNFILIILFTLFLNACDNSLPAGSNVDSSFTDSQNIYCMIDLRGEVIYPGIYKVESGTLLNEVIELAGGVTKNADLSKISLVSIITENTKIIIPNINSDYNTITKINLNTCSIEELLSIPKIGEVKAKAIIDYRNKHGIFINLEDLKKVNGIGDNLFEEIKAYLTI